ncbi:MAG: Asp-tRNA(Asn)/Glu-tRNA(Gln) amidotransferase subunit GatA [Candidatus Paceibacterota bacterium]|nr:MAG: Asp-tRNA(Asn)/Glu-tRNA(Gln) amidotransferase subunit GatA [Candidatus Paceibacterota bacterium]
MQHTLTTFKEAQLTEGLERLLAEYRAAREARADLNAFISDATVMPAHTQGLLAGAPIAVKDNILVRGEACTAGSRILEGYIATYHATVVEKLLAAGATIFGKTNLDEFAMGSSTENSAFGVVKNPLDTSRVPGGSSGGSAAAVAAGLCVAALGTDTGGSIRQPAAFCGIVGLKPTYGRVSRHGAIAMGSSLDQIGPLTRNVADAAHILEVIAGHDPYDATTVERPVPAYTEKMLEDISGLRVGVVQEHFGDGLAPEVRENVEQAIEALRAQGAQIVDVSLPHAPLALAVYYVVMPCEVSANLARFDGVRYGFSDTSAETVLEAYERARSGGFGAEPKRRIILGTYALSAGYFDAYYMKAQRVRALISQDYDRAFENVDVIVGPTTPTTAFRIGEKSDDPLAMYLSDMYTVPANLAGLPALSVPYGVGRESGMPVGVHITSKAFDEETMLRIGYALERAV